MGPAFRADQVGSMIRPASLADMFSSRTMLDPNHSTEELDIINAAVRSIANKQLELSIRPITTGEYDRKLFFDGFYENLEGMKVEPSLRLPEDFRRGLPSLEAMAKVGAKTFGCVVAVSKISHERSAFLPTWNMLKQSLARDKWAECKMTMASITWPHVSLAHGAYKPEAYTSDREYFTDLAACYRAELKALYDAGLRHVQIDDPLMTYFVLDDFREQLLRDGTDPDELLDLYIWAHNEVLRDIPADLTVGIHLCRGNMPKNMAAHVDFNASGSYERIAELLFTKLRYKKFYLEFDDERSGGFEPLRWVPRHTQIVLGLVSTKTPQLEDIEVLEKRVKEAAAVIAAAQNRSVEAVLADTLAVSPQCGFATSDRSRGVETEERMWEKLTLVRDLARRIWPSEE
ncbi:hypothetical protein QQS21_006018 [Conoideocrella luteorostrata]|uniref:Cobalamin-independent methionine synthase MetE C-terminal/archaeal domain-containing protein n=1 Tax=Conoideocrella luteorostrata TaxID=1105319 RepID=A0AAJ0CQU6_9HYPO|nr:hypothetical protein QQS21_006018 [Conoideocrella luteorostrata]